MPLLSSPLLSSPLLLPSPPLFSPPLHSSFISSALLCSPNLSSLLLSPHRYGSPYRSRQLTWQHAGKRYAFNRNIGYVGTFFHFVAQARGKVAAGGVIWFGVDDASLSPRVPMYAVTDRTPASYAYGNGDTARFSSNAAYWAFNLLSNWAYSRVSVIGRDVQHQVVDTERKLMAQLAAADAAAATALREHGPEAAAALCSNFSVSTADAVVASWTVLFQEMFVRYRDGLVVTAAAPDPNSNPKDLPPPPSCEAGGYSVEWYGRVAADDGGQYELPIEIERPGLATDPGRAWGEHTDRKLRLLSRQ